MNTYSHSAWIGLIAVNALLWLVFVAGPTADADPRRPATLPVNPATQRGEMIRELSEIKQLLKEQNQIFRSVKVVVMER